jgi:hypothetical protein
LGSKVRIIGFCARSYGKDEKTEKQSFGCKMTSVNADAIPNPQNKKADS